MEKKARKLYLFNCKSAKTYSCWRIWLSGDSFLDSCIQAAVIRICREGITSEGIIKLREFLVKKDDMLGEPQSIWRIMWNNRDVAKIEVNEEGEVFEIYLMLS